MRCPAAINFSCRTAWAGLHAPRYCNVDYTLASALQHLGPFKKIGTYDIGCQFGKNYEARQGDLPLSLRSTLYKPGIMTWAVPKFHLAAHKAVCQSEYNVRYIPGIGVFDGEGIERNWAYMIRVGPSTREMGPGSRHDRLNDCWGDNNFLKLIGMGRRAFCKPVLLIADS